MLFRTLPSATLLATTLMLAACGGGGGGGDSISNVILSGNAAKGVLIGADVKAFEIVNGIPSATALSTGTTDNTGAYTLTSTPTSNPVLVQVSVNANTLMLDETQIQADGAFKKISAPSNLTLRSFVTSLNETTKIQINPLTEAAVAIASASVGADKKLTTDGLIAAKQMVAQMAPAGVNPFTVSPPIAISDMTSEQASMAMMMAGLVKTAGGACDVKCQVGLLSKDLKITMQSDGTGEMSQALATDIQKKRTELLTKGRAVWTTESENAKNLDAKLADMRTTANAAVDSSQQTAVKTKTASASDFTAAEGLEGFVTALRNGFRETEKNLSASEADLKKKYESAVSLGTQQISEITSQIVADCLALRTEFKCSPSGEGYPPLNWIKNPNAGTWTGTTVRPLPVWNSSTGSMTNVKWDITVSGESTGSAASFTASANIKNASTNKLLVKIDRYKADLSGLDSTYDRIGNSYTGPFNGTIGASIQIFDQTANSDLTVTLGADNWLFAYDQAKIKLSGGLSLSTNRGDSMIGSLSVNGIDKGMVTTTTPPNRGIGSFGGGGGATSAAPCIAPIPGSNYSSYCSTPTPPPTYTYRDANLTDFEFKLRANNNNSELLKLSLIVSIDPQNSRFPVNAANFDKYSGEVSATLTNTLSVKFKTSRSIWDTQKVEASIDSGGSLATLTADLKRSEATGNLNDKWCTESDNVLRCSKTLMFTSGNNVYIATLTRPNGKTQGDIYKGSSKVGAIQNGMIQINGIEYSIY